MAPKPGNAATAKTQASTTSRENFFTHIKNSKIETGSFLLFHLIAALFLSYYYPFADMTSDTGGYIKWAIDGLYGSTRPRGYSSFLYQLHDISHSTTIIFVTQYIIYCFAQLFLFLTATYLFQITSKGLKIGFLAFLICSLANLYLANTAMSDSLFGSVTVLMITCCIWFIYRQTVVTYISIVTLMMAAITIRYIALIYPAIIFLVFLISLKDKKILIGACFFMILPMYAYYERVSAGTEKDMGVRVFSAFGGWQKASNALHIIPHIDLSKPLVESDNEDILLTDSVVRNTYPFIAKKYPEKNSVCYDFIWIDSLPLKQAVFIKLSRVKNRYHATWNHMGAVYSDYADLLIKKYPTEFARYYLLPNFKRTLLPPVEIFEKYRITGAMGPYEKSWFHVENDSLAAPRADILRPALKQLSPFYAIFWFVFFVNIIASVVIVYKKILPYNSKQLIAGYLITLFILLYFAGSVYAAPTNLRFIVLLRALIITQTVLYAHIILTKPEPQLDPIPQIREDVPPQPTVAPVKNKPQKQAKK